MYYFTYFCHGSPQISLSLSFVLGASDADADPYPTYNFDADPDPSFKIESQNLEKVLKLAHILYILA